MHEVAIIAAMLFSFLLATPAVSELESETHVQGVQATAKNVAGTDPRIRQPQKLKLGFGAYREPDLALLGYLELWLKKSAKDQRYRVVVVNRV